MKHKEIVRLINATPNQIAKEADRYQRQKKLVYLDVDLAQFKRTFIQPHSVYMYIS